jgi:hypothetical protein
MRFYQLFYLFFSMSAAQLSSKPSIATSGPTNLELRAGQEAAAACRARQSEQVENGKLIKVTVGTLMKPYKVFQEVTEQMKVAGKELQALHYMAAMTQREACRGKPRWNKKKQRYEKKNMNRKSSVDARWHPDKVMVEEWRKMKREERQAMKIIGDQKDKIVARKKRMRNLGRAEAKQFEKATWKNGNQVQEEMQKRREFRRSMPVVFRNQSQRQMDSISASLTYLMKTLKGENDEEERLLRQTMGDRLKMKKKFEEELEELGRMEGMLERDCARADATIKKLTQEWQEMKRGKAESKGYKKNAKGERIHFY